MSRDEAPLTPLEQALVAALVSALAKELRKEERERPGDQTEALVDPEEPWNGDTDDSSRAARSQFPKS